MSLSPALSLFSFWHGSRLQDLQLLSTHLASSTGLPVSLYSYEIHDNVPERLRKNANEIISEESLFKNPGRKSFSGFSNIFRYQRILSKGGIWFDLDFFFTKTPPARFPLFAWEDNQFINGAVLGDYANSAFARRLLEEGMEISKLDFRWGDLGPKLITRVARDMNLDGYGLPSTSAYEIRPTEAWKFFDPRTCSEVKQRLTGAFGFHLWNEVLRTTSPEIQSLVPPEGSYLWRIASDSGFHFAEESEKMSPDWVAKVLRSRTERFNSIEVRLMRRAKLFYHTILDRRE